MSGVVMNPAFYLFWPSLLAQNSKFTTADWRRYCKEGEAFLIDDRIFQAAEIGRIHAKAA
jgi:hypothetical protein